MQQTGRLDEAEAIYANLIDASPDDAIALINGGVLALARTISTGGRVIVPRRRLLR